CAIQRIVLSKARSTFFPRNGRAAPKSLMKRPLARCRKSLRATQDTSCAMAGRELSCDQRTSTRLQQRSIIYIDILKSSNAWATRHGDGSLKILRGIIFGRDCWTLTKSRCEKRRNQLCTGSLGPPMGTEKNATLPERRYNPSDREHSPPSTQAHR